MKSFSYFIIVAILILLEILLVPRLTIFGVRPNLVLLAILGWFILTDFKEAIKWLWGAAIILDFGGALPFGVVSLSLLFTLFLVYLFSLRVFREKNWSTVFFLSLTGSLIYNFLLIIFTKLFTLIKLSHFAIDLTYYSVNLILPTLFYNLLVILILYRILKHYRLWLAKINESF